MNLQFESRFEKDLRTVKDKQLLSKIKAIIIHCKQAESVSEITNMKKLKGYDTFYRIRVGDYRIGLELLGDKLIFTRFLHRKDVYKYFP